MSSPYQRTYFLLSVADVKQLPPDVGKEVAVVGRSNVGKSSVLNCLTQQKGLARVSKTPGRTQHINIFVIDDERRFADLPGYGYAKVPHRTKTQWQKTVDSFLRTRQCLKGLVLVMDVRHPLKELDRLLLDFCDHYELPVHIVLNKADKLSKAEAAKTLAAIQAAVAGYHVPVTLQLFSALKKTGVKELHAILNAWFEI